MGASCVLGIGIRQTACAPYSMLYWAFDKSKTPYYPWLISFRVEPYHCILWSPEFRQGQALPRVAGCIEPEMGLKCSQLIVIVPVLS